MRHPFVRVALFVFAAPLLMAGCGGDDGGTEPDPVTISVNPSTLTLFVGDTDALTADVSGASGASVDWSSSASAVATVSGSGLVTAVGLGSATITASVAGEGVSAVVDVTVRASTITVEPASAEIEVDETVQLAATVTGGSGLTVSWVSADDAVATVDGAGTVTGVASGTVDVTASVDGQPGVEATASVRVTEPPSISNVEFVDGQGLPLDLNDIGDVIAVSFDVEGEAGTAVEVDLQVGDVVLASETVTIAAAPGLPAGLGAARGRTRVDLEGATPVVSLTTDQVEELAAGAQDVSLLLNGIAGVTTEGTVNPSPHLFLRGVNANTLVLVNGRRVTNTDMALTANLAFASQIERIEVLADGSSAVYGADAVGGVVNFILKAENRSGSGPTTFASVTGYDADDNPYDIRIGTADLVRGGTLEEAPDFDGEDPVYDGPFETSDPWFVGSEAGYEVPLYQRAAWRLDRWGDYSGIAAHDFDVAAASTPTDWSYAGVTTGADLTGLDGLPFLIRTRATDPFGQYASRTLLNSANGQPFMAYADLTPPAIHVAPGGIQPYTLGLGATGVFGLGTTNTPGADGPARSDLDTGSALGRVRYDTPTGSVYLRGSAEEFTSSWDVFGGGVTFDFESLGPGVARGEFSIADGAGNRASMQIDGVYNPNPTRVEDLTVSGTYDPTFTLSLRATFFDDLDVLFGAPFVRYDGVVGGTAPLYMIPGFLMTGDGFDDQLTREGTFDFQIDAAPHVIQLTETSFPQEPNGQRFPASVIGVGAFNSGGNFSWADESVDGRYNLTDRVFGTQGDDHYEVVTGPSILYNAFGNPSCTLPQSHDFELLAYTSGTFPANRAQLLYRKSLPGDLNVALPAGDPVDLTVIDRGGFFEGQASTTLDATLLNLPPDVIGVQWLLMSIFGEALLTPISPFEVVPC